MLRTIKLHGELGQKYGPEFRLSVLTPAEAVRALTTQIRGLEADIRAGQWICVRGDYDTGLDCDEELLHLRFGQLDEFHIIPAAMGRKNGVGKILVGIALIAATVITGGAIIAAIPTLGLSLGGAIGTFGIGGSIAALGTLGFAAAGVGALLVLSGVAQLVAPTPSGSGTSTSADDKAGFLFNGAVNTSQQGAACPLVFGRIQAGSVVVSAGIITERIGAANTDYSSTGGNLTYSGDMPVWTYPV